MTMSQKRNKEIADDVGRLIGVAEREAGRGLSKSCKYATIRAKFPKLPKQRAKVLAGYSPRSSMTELERTAGIRNAVRTIEQQREDLRSQQGYGFGDSVKFYGVISKDPKEGAGDRIKARTRVDSLLGYDAPTQHKVTTTGLMVELKDLSAGQIQQIIDSLPVHSLDSKPCDKISSVSN